MIEVKENITFSRRLKNIFIGHARDISDNTTFHKISLIAFFAWVGLGADALTSSCYGPEEAFRNLTGHPALAIFVGLATAITIFIISTSYSQIIQLFPGGGGGYIVASKLLSPMIGMVSGCSLLIDYVLTITLSISSGADAIFSFFPIYYQQYKLSVALLGVILLIVMNLRGVKESVMSLTPIFVLFITTHIFVIFYVLFKHSGDISGVAKNTVIEVHNSVSELGIFGTIFLILRAYSMGAGTFTGIEAVSNGMPILREPKVKTAKRTMRLMAFSLAFIVLGLFIAYFLYNVSFHEGKTLNAVLFEKMTLNWNFHISNTFIIITLASEAALLFVAAQTGFIDGPRIMANMARDSWFPKRFASYSDRLVTQNGVMLMGAFSLILLIASKGSVRFLVVLYSINVFVTFSLSQFGMVKHWWQSKKTEKKWIRKLLINGIGLILTTFILISVTLIKFSEGGWITLFITGILVVFAISIKKHYYNIAIKLHKLQSEISVNIPDKIKQLSLKKIDNQTEFNSNDKTAILLVSGYNGTGLHSLFKIIESFSGIYKNFIFVQVGIVDSGNFRNSEEVNKLKSHVDNDINKYVDIVNSLGFHGKSIWTVNTEIVNAIDELVPELVKDYPDSTFFGGQLIFSQSYYLSRFLHNHTIFAIQRSLYKKGITTIILPIYVN